MKAAYPAAVLTVLCMLFPCTVHAICGRSPAVSIEPTTAKKGPANTQVRVTLPLDWRKDGLCPRAELATCHGGTWDLSLRRAPEPGRVPVSVDAKLVHSESGVVATEVLTPLAALTAGDYEVWAIERTDHIPSRIVAVFAVTSAIDHTPPTWPGLRAASYTKRPHGANGTVTIPSECGDEIASVTVLPATDDQTPQISLRFALWISPAEIGVDYSKPPVLYAAADNPSLRISLGSTIEEQSNFSSGATAKNPYPPLRIGMRAVDQAGNMSAPSELVIR